jgi:NAD-dependent dihydropyrimidine dehydrogenase PreA subunit
MPKVIVDQDKCDGCGTCIDVCPVTVFELQDVEGKKLSIPIKPDECILCMACTVNCPTEAITVEE